MWPSEFATPAEAMLIADVAHQDPYRRAEAATALGRTILDKEDPELLEKLACLLEDPIASVRSAAVESLTEVVWKPSEFGEVEMGMQSRSALPAAFAAVASRLQHNNDFVRLCAVDAMIRMSRVAENGEAEALIAVTPLLHHSDSAVRCAALRSVVGTGAGRNLEAKSPLSTRSTTASSCDHHHVMDIDALSPKQRRMENEMIIGVATLKGEAEHASNWAANEEEKVLQLRAMAAEAEKRAKAAQREAEEARMSAAEAEKNASRAKQLAEESLVKALEDERSISPQNTRYNSDLRLPILAAKDQNLIIPESDIVDVKGLLKDDDERVRKAALELLAQSAVSPQLRSVQESDEAQLVVEAVLPCVSDEALQATTTALIKLEDPSAEVRKAAVLSLSKVVPRGDALVTAQLLDMLSGNERRTKLSALRALALIAAPGHLQTLDAVTERLQDTDATVRMVAMDAIGSIAAQGSLILAKSVCNGLKDTDSNVRRSALTKLPQTVGPNVDQSEAAQLALPFLEDKDWAVRWAAVDAVAELSPLGARDDYTIRCLQARLEDSNASVRRAARLALEV